MNIRERLRRKKTKNRKAVKYSPNFKAGIDIGLKNKDARDKMRKFSSLVDCNDLFDINKPVAPLEKWMAEINKLPEDKRKEALKCFKELLAISTEGLEERGLPNG